MSVMPLDPPCTPAALSAREIEVMCTWLRKDTKETTARALHISLGTVNTHLARIRVKYSAAGRPAPSKAALLIRAVQDGLLDLDELLRSGDLR